jgi:predicted ATPase/class 3 adenylate cyclase
LSQPEQVTPIDYSEPQSYTPKFLADKILTTRSSIEGERKLVTVIFADVANYTSMAEKVDPEEVHQIMDGCFKILMDEIHKYEGTINQFTGDGVMALFGAPLAHEDHAQRACHASLSIQNAMVEYGEKIKKDRGVDFKMRIGINSGPVIVGSIGDDLRMDYTAVGDTTNLASRMESMAGAGTIFVSGGTYRLVRDFFEFESLGKVEVKGKKEPQEAFELIKTGEVETRIGASMARGLTRFVGRKDSMDALMVAYENAESGKGQVMGVVGEAGVGKSRLILELRNMLPKGEYRYLEGQCLHFGASMSYLPILDILRSFLEIKEGDPEHLIKEKMEDRVTQLDENLKASLPPLQDLLSLKVEDEAYLRLDPKQKRGKVFEAVRNLLIRESQNNPLVLAVEDLHWIDKTSEELLSYLVEGLANKRILLILLYRPEYIHQWGSKSYYNRIGLHQLTTNSSADLVQAILEGGEVVPELRELILGRAAGNPLFIEEFIQSLLENGFIKRENNHYALSRKASDIQVPDTIHGIIAARLDRLEDNLKRTMQVASVVGRDFAYRIVQSITGMKEELKNYFLSLQALDFIHEKNLFPELEYIFKHALTQEVAYNSVLSKRRGGLHKAIGLAMEELYQESLPERYEELAHHFTKGEAWEKAFDYLLKSGDKARQAFAHYEATEFYTQAIQVSSQITPAPDQEKLITVYEGRGLVWMLLTKYDDAIADFQMMRQMSSASSNQRKEGQSLWHLAFAHFHKLSDKEMDLAERYAQEALLLSRQTGDQRILSDSLAVLASVDQSRGNLSEADRKFEESLQISRQEGYKEVLPRGLGMVGHQAYWQGDFQRAIKLGQEGAAISCEIHDGFNELLNLANLCTAYQSLAKYRQARDTLEEGLSKARERESQFFIGRLTNTLGWFHSEFGDLSRALEYDHESVELGRKYQVSNVEISALINLGLDYLALGEHERASSYLKTTLDRVQREAFGAHRWRWKVRLFIGLADLAYTTGAYEEALRYVEEGLKEAHATSSQKYVAKGHGLRGKIVAKSGDSDSAGVELQRAITLAERLHSPALIYPLAYDLGQWYESGGKEQEAAELYGKAKATIERMATAVEDETLSSVFLKSTLVQAIHERAARLGG